MSNMINNMVKGPTEKVEQKPKVREFKISVNYNDDFLVRQRKITSIKIGLWFLVLGLTFGLGTLLYNDLKSIYRLGLGIFSLVFLAIAVILLAKSERLAINENSTLDLDFKEFGLYISRSNRKIMMEACSYKKSLANQYVSRIEETIDCLKIKIYAGSYSGILPFYNKYIIPKRLVKQDIRELREFLKSKLGNRYISKIV